MVRPRQLGAVPAMEFIVAEGDNDFDDAESNDIPDDESYLQKNESMKKKRFLLIILTYHPLLML